MSTLVAAPENLALTRSIQGFIAKHISVKPEVITAHIHLGDDLGLDLFDVVQLTVLLEERFTDGVSLDPSQPMEFVGDLVHYIEACNLAKELQLLGDGVIRQNGEVESESTIPARSLAPNQSA
jgi:acyl carrier protein